MAAALALWVGAAGARDFLRKAGEALAAGHPAEAASFYQQALSASPQDPSALFGLARARMLEKKWSECSELFSRFRLSYPDHPQGGKALLYLTECEENAADAVRPKKAIVPPVAAPLGEGGPLLAAQVLVWDAKSWEELEKEMKALKAAGFSAVIFRVFSNPGDRLYPFAGPAKTPVGVYFQTKQAPVVSEILWRATQVAHRSGLAFYAWMTSRYADYGLDSKIAGRWADRTYDLSKKEIVQGKGLDIFNEEVLAHLEALYGDLGSYPIDAVLFQDDLVSRHTDGFSEAAARAYAKKFGRPLDPSAFYQDVYQPPDSPKPRVGKYTDAFWEWARWKNERLLDVAERLAGAVKKKRPDAKVAVNFMYEAASSPRNSLAWLSQSISAAHRRKFDYYAVMAYHRQMMDELGLSVDEVATLLRRMSRSLYAGAHPFRTLFKLQIRDWETQEPVSKEEFSKMLEAIRKGAEGTGAAPNIAVVPYRGRKDLDRLSFELRSLAERQAGARE